MSKIIVLAEHSEGSVVKAFLSAVTAARQLAEKTGGGFDIAVVGHNVASVAAELTGFGATTVYQVEDADFEGYTARFCSRFP